MRGGIRVLGLGLLVVMLLSFASARADRSVVLTFAGDCTLGSEEALRDKDYSFDSYAARYGYDYFFAGFKDIFASDDLTCVNLECVLKDDGSGEDTKKQWRFRGLTSYAAILSEGSVELVNLANNHTIDYGEQGFDSTVHALEGYAEWCGPEHPTAVMIKGHMFGFAGCRETMYINDPVETDKDGNSLSLMDLIDDGKDIHEQVDVLIRSRQLYTFLKKSLDKRELEIIVYRYGLYGTTPHTQNETAEKLGISRSYVSRLEKKAIGKLKKMFDSSPV